MPLKHSKSIQRRSDRLWRFKERSGQSPPVRYHLSPMLLNLSRALNLSQLWQYNTQILQADMCNWNLTVRLKELGVIFSHLLRSFQVSCPKLVWQIPNVTSDPDFFFISALPFLVCDCFPQAHSLISESIDISFLSPQVEWKRIRMGKVKGQIAPGRSQMILSLLKHFFQTPLPSNFCF